MKIQTNILIIFVLLLVSLSLFSQSDKMAWWREARFGMFIHWGVYAVYGNVYDGVDINGEQVHYDKRTTGMPAEWILSAAKIPRATYREAAKEFEAKDYDPKKWVEIAQKAGMKYIVITAKHHDGFCLFETQYTDWNAIDASAAKRDLLKELVQEAKKAGLKIGFYYSQNLDWMSEGGMGAVPELNGATYPLDKVEAYVDTQVIPQIKELTTNYDIDLFWFDYPGVNNSNTEISQRILDALLESPIGNKVIYNNRLFSGFDGDFSTPENDTPQIPYNGYSDGRDWEACSSLNTSWGYESDPETETVWTLLRWKSTIYTISRILELSSKGGNFLLNVGPDKQGVIPEHFQSVLTEVGEWMNIYGETIYGTEKNNLVNPFEYGYVTQKRENNGVHWYLHISPAYWTEKEIVLTGVTELPQTAVLFETKESLKVELKNNNLIISLPDNCPNSYYATLDFYFTNAPTQIAQSGIRNGIIRLTPFQATVNDIKKDYVPYSLKNWYRKNAEIGVDIFLDAGEYTIEAEYAAWVDGGEIYFKIDNNDYTGNYKSTGNAMVPNDLGNYITDDFGGIKITLPESKIYSIKIKRNAEIPNVTNWINVRSFIFKKEVADSTVNINPQIRIYPSLIKNGYFICESPEMQTLRIYDSLGRYCKTFTVDDKKPVNVEELDAGVYSVVGENFSEKIIIQ
ncbi:MAG: alpha-L-fucosidase [Dysgonamonadaceae bacterium]|nr:alpha-L-fucosidase [Dysgonamonadaceae bacterium]